MLKKYVFHENLGLGISKPYEIKYYYFQKITGNGGKITGNFPLPVMKKNMEILHPYLKCIFGSFYILSYASIHKALVCLVL